MSCLFVDAFCVDSMNKDNDGNVSLETPFVNVTSDGEAYPKYWIAVLVQMCTEKKVGERLSKLNIENYVPTQLELHQWSDRKKKVERVVIPMVVFVKVDSLLEQHLKTYSFIYKILSYPGDKHAAVIPEEQIERLKFMLDHADSSVELNNDMLQVGEKVRIVRGSLKGLEGELHIVDADKMMVAIRIECLGCACVNIALTDVERL